MEGTPNPVRNQPSGWEAWDAVPRDGPAVFIVDTAALDSGELHGCWFDPTLPVDILSEQLRRFVGAELTEGRIAVVDQIGLGPLMMSEKPVVDELQAEADATFRAQDAVDSTTLEPLPE
jgi:hypothetical protein